MSVRAVALLLLSCLGCSREARPPVAAPAPGAQLEPMLRQVLHRWAPKDGGAELSLEGDTRHWRKGDDAVAGSVLLGRGESLSFVEKHFHWELTLRAVDPQRMTFDYRYRHRPPHGDAEEAAGELVITSAADPRWFVCKRDVDCAVIPTVCGAVRGVAVPAQDAAASYYRHFAELASCRAGTVQAAAPPTPSCSAGSCLP